MSAPVGRRYPVITSSAVGTQGPYTLADHAAGLAARAPNSERTSAAMRVLLPARIRGRVPAVDEHDDVLWAGGSLQPAHRPVQLRRAGDTGAVSLDGDGRLDGLFGANLLGRGAHEGRRKQQQCRAARLGLDSSAPPLLAQGGRRFRELRD